jgi:hypothetical protein
LAMRVMNALVANSFKAPLQLGCIAYSFVNLRSFFRDYNSVAFSELTDPTELMFGRDLKDIEPNTETQAITSETDFKFYATLWLKYLADSRFFRYHQDLLHSAAGAKARSPPRLGSSAANPVPINGGR